MQEKNNWIKVKIAEALGSTPRNVGTLMWVSESEILNSIGGGRLEFLAVKKARAMLVKGLDFDELSVPLGPITRQCCGGYVKLEFQSTPTPCTENKNKQIVYIFGQGHVGGALSKALIPLPFNVVRVDSRESFSSDIRNPIECVKAAHPSSWHLIMTHDHGLDLEICSALLEQKNFGFIGLIGSKSKRARFFKQLRLQGFDPTPIKCPIGITGIRNKEPSVIAASVAAELLILQSASDLKKKRSIVA